MVNSKYIVAITLCGLLTLQSHSLDTDMVVVVNINNPTSTMSKSQVIDLFMGRYTSFPNGEKAIPIELTGDREVKKSFYRDLLGMSLARVTSYWSRIKYTGRVRPSIKLSTQANIVNHISKTPLSIGYMPRSKLTEQLKIVYVVNE